MTQVVSWGTLYYAFSVLAPALQKDLGMSAALVLGCFAGSILVSGVAAPLVGVFIDRWGGKVMAVGSLVSGVGCFLLGLASEPVTLAIAFVLLGLGMAGTLYDAAFACIVKADPSRSRRTISFLTLFGGLASTAFWPLSAWLLAAVGWRETYVLFAIFHVLLCVPLHWWLPDSATTVSKPKVSMGETTSRSVLWQTLKGRDFWLLAFAFGTNSFIFSALAIQMLPLLESWHHQPAEVLWMTALVGPMQVAGRVVELASGGRFPVRWVGMVPFVLLPLSFAGLWLWGTAGVVAVIFCCCYGISNGLVTIVRGVSVKEHFDPTHYGLVSGLIAGVGVAFRAVGPFVVGLVIQQNPSPVVATVLLLGTTVSSLVLFSLVSRPKESPKQDREVFDKSSLET